MQPSLSDISYFIEIANTLNVSRAAERLGISQPSLSTAIKRLESILNTPLLIRTKSGVQLTKAGQQFLLQAKELQSKWESIKSSINSSHDEISGHYKIGCHPSVAQFTLPYFLPQLLQEHPHLQIDLKHDLSRIITEQVISYEVDFGLVVNPIAHPDLVIKTIGADQVQFWISKKAKNIPTDTLLCNSILSQTQALLTQLKRRKIHFSRHISSSSLEVIAKLCVSGAGVALLPANVVKEGYSQDLKLFGDSLPSFEDTVAFIYRSDLPKTAAMKKIIALVSNLAKTK